MSTPNQPSSLNGTLVLLLVAVAVVCGWFVWESQQLRDRLSALEHLNRYGAPETAAHPAPNPPPPPTPPPPPRPPVEMAAETISDPLPGRDSGGAEPPSANEIHPLLADVARAHQSGNAT
jgi:hypothetical protein